MNDQHSIREVFGGVDTHALTHHAAVVDSLGRELADREFPATPAGYEAALETVPFAVACQDRLDAALAAAMAADSQLTAVTRKLCCAASARF